MAKQSDKPRQIIDATFRLLKDKRYYEITTDDIANEAKVGKGTIYRYFKDKDDLLIELATAIVVKLADLCKKSVEKADSLKGKLTLILPRLVRLFLKKTQRFLKS